VDELMLRRTMSFRFPVHQEGNFYPMIIANAEYGLSTPSTDYNSLESDSNEAFDHLSCNVQPLPPTASIGKTSLTAFLRKLI
jgi:hypothetical protein